MSSATDRRSITFENFKLESKNILAELETYYEAKKRSIDHCFQILLDNLPNEIKNVSINKIYESYLNQIEQKTTHHNENSDDEINVTEFQDDTVNDHHLNKESIKNLTSTVKKPNGNFLPQTKFDSIINEHSIIHEKSECANSKADDICVGVYYYLKDGTKANTKLSNLNDIEMKDVHANCVDDLTDLFKFYGLLISKKY